MSKDQVRTIIGEPTRVEVDEIDAWYYSCPEEFPSFRDWAALRGITGESVMTRSEFEELGKTYEQERQRMDGTSGGILEGRVRFDDTGLISWMEPHSSWWDRVIESLNTSRGLAKP